MSLSIGSVTGFGGRGKKEEEIVDAEAVFVAAAVDIVAAVVDVVAPLLLLLPKAAFIDGSVSSFLLEDCTRCFCADPRLRKNYRTGLRTTCNEPLSLSLSLSLPLPK